jgi:hypothetical protein
MEDLEALVEYTRGLKYDDLVFYYKNTHSCIVRRSGRLFCPFYHFFKTKFSALGAKATRGTVFVLDEDGYFQGQIACLPFFKFFCRNQTGAHQGDAGDIVAMHTKLDGSLIKLFKFGEEWIVATNSTPVGSDFFVALFERAIGLPSADFDQVFDVDKTYIFELCTPENRVVVPYDTYRATLLMTRCRYSLEELPNAPNEHHYDMLEELAEFDESNVGTEGAVVLYKGGQRVKLKTAWYRALHAAQSPENALKLKDWAYIQRMLLLGTFSPIADKISPEMTHRAELFTARMSAFEAFVERGLEAHGLSLAEQPDKDSLRQALKGGLVLFHSKEITEMSIGVLFGNYRTLFTNAKKASGVVERFRI